MNALKRTCIFSIALLSACAPPKPAEEPPVNVTMPVAERKTQTDTVSSWVISGAMAAKNKNKAWSASLNWRQQGMNKYQIRLFGPLGGGTVIIEKEGGAITYKDGPKTITSQNADDLLQQQTGIRLPVNNLYYWVRGLPAPGPVQASKYDEYNHLISLQQAGYHINYESYTSVNKIDLPSKIRLQGNGVSIKLIIKQWSVG
ncbi:MULTISPECIES: lipoprotein insertase outer membrane protein LolB [Legionella]|uniref:Outer-membrane lipoprotein LolB n=1 Tax=Legionella septentrionalis TaxID=2498109 RepID=A0A3S0XUE2_9GAMM|nr:MULTISPECIES: lipoprotein insertase outer membrane protein LolB [Legionella]MCP0913941.1 lipoprotein insertase outer membrane protein LolB [Legionella sp. 27cVA30]RUQ90448.1 outer membrane lipoprotein LolB [Legionella septentrionalis]RUR00080.1 outer membrane lipoprotein LolB [Legionella septentrionalis]RUR16560.1 outer membrane lipoprotein LolB [Legionella septentrionalis]